ncbi:MAG TPA: hypothetical protein VEG60_08400, partial [Candidatus Binatia bacterium]|nr:hypothetical protein [Candidatus Binatia bacterium]
MHMSVPTMGQYVRSVILGHMRYYAVSMNAVSVSDFRMAVGRFWWRVLERRCQKAYVSCPMKRQFICAKHVAASDINYVIAVAIYRQSLALKNILLSQRQRQIWADRNRELQRSSKRTDSTATGNLA